MATAFPGGVIERSRRSLQSETLRRLLVSPTASYYLLLGIAGMLVFLGLVMVLSASSVLSERVDGSAYSIFIKQMVWVAVGLAVAWGTSRLSHSMLRRLAWPGLALAAVLIGLTYVPGLGVSVNGNRNWLSLGGPLQIQPSEFAKIALVLWSADVYARKEVLLRRWGHLLVPVMPVSFLLIGLVVGQGDLGTALVLFAVLLTMLWVVGAPLRLFSVSLVGSALVAFALALSSPDRVARMTTFLDPLRYYQGQGWQVSHGFFAFANGGIFGRGIGASAQKWGALPEAHTDFILAIIGEELGLIGTLFTLALFGGLAYVTVRIAIRTSDVFICCAAAGIFAWLLGQASINIAMVLGLLPVIGIPLPLISYGGSSMVANLLAVGILVSFARTEASGALPARISLRSRWERPNRRTTRATPHV